MTGKALSKKDGKVFYTEVHEIEVGPDGRVILDRIKYLSPQAKTLAEMTCDFKKSQFMPDVAYFDHRDKYEFKSNYDPARNKIELTKKETESSRPESVVMDAKDDMITFPGIGNFIRVQLSKLVQGEAVSLKYVMPSRKDVYSVQLKKLSLDEKEHKLKVKLEASNFFIRQILNEIILTVDTQTFDILEFEGRSLLLDDSDHPMDVVVRYK